MDVNNVNQEVNKNKRKSLGDEEDSIRDEKTSRNDSGQSSVDKGQPDDDEDLRKLEEKRAYNRKNAARARQRTKEHILELTARAERYASKNEQLQQANDSLTAEVERLTEENQRLRQLVKMPGSSPPGTVAASAQVGLPPSTVAPVGIPLGGPVLMDHQAGLQHGGPGTTSYYFVPASQGDFSNSGVSVQSTNDNNAARQRGLLLHLLQSQGDARQGLPPGFNPY